MEEPASPALTAAVLIAGTVSLAVLFRLFQIHIDGRPLLPYEPRRAAPWNALAPLLMLAPVMIPLGRALVGWGAVAEEPSPLAFVTALALSAAGAAPAAAYGGAAAASLVDGIALASAKAESMPLLLVESAAVTILLALACYALLGVAFGATRRDLGLPADGRQALRDIRVGAIAFAASLAPIYGALLALNLAFPSDQAHPLIEELVVHHSPAMMAAAALMAVVAAPLYEETAFRLVLQGWLERRESPSSSGASPAGDGRQDDSHAAGEPTGEPDGGAGGVPGGQTLPKRATWGPVVLSGTLFGLAHTGQGLAPAPLVLLGFVLGYVYQRTHRILPCIVCHMLFNGYTFLMLSLQFASR